MHIVAGRRPGKAFFQRASCGKQVFSELAVARRFAHRLAQFGIRAHATRCAQCGLIHVVEKRDEGWSEQERLPN